MFGIGGSEMLVIALVAILVFGPGRIPEVARSISAAYRELTRLRRQMGDTVSELRQEIDLTVDLDDELPQPLRPPAGARVPRGRENFPPSGETSGVSPGNDLDDYLAPPSSSSPVQQPGAAIESVIQSASDDYLNGVARGE